MREGKKILVVLQAMLGASNQKVKAGKLRRSSSQASPRKRRGGGGRRQRQALRLTTWNSGCCLIREGTSPAVLLAPRHYLGAGETLSWNHLSWWERKTRETPPSAGCVPVRCFCTRFAPNAVKSRHFGISVQLGLRPWWRKGERKLEKRREGQGEWERKRWSECPAVPVSEVVKKRKKTR